MNFNQRNFIADDLKRIYPQAAEKLSGLYGSVILLTGGAGFLGSWICELVSYLNRADKANIKLFVVDRDRELFFQRLPHLAQDELIQFIRCDVRSLVEMPREVNYVIHAAATPDSRFHASSPIETMTTIAEGTSSVLRAANRVSNLVKFLNVSSSSIYASGSELTSISESAPGLALGTQSAAYAEAKRYAEALCNAARSEARIPVVTVRPFTFCGAYQRLDSPWVINNFINDALNQRPIRILGDGKSVRSLMYGADFAYWLLVIMLHSDSGEVFNIGNNAAYSVADLASKVAACFSPRPNILTNTSLTSIRENSRLVPNVDAAKKRFGLDIYTDVDLTIARTIEWYRAGL